MAVRWGIVTAGKASHDFVSVLRTLSKEEHQVVAVAARDLSKAQEFATLHGIPKAYGSYEDLAKDEDIEIAYVAVLNRDHLRIGTLMLESGKHVLMEKPMCMNLKQTSQLVAVARRKNLFLMEAMWSRFFPAYKILEDELNRKTIGDIVHVHLTQGFKGTDSDRIQQKELGGSVILDVGVYLLNSITCVFREKPEKLAVVAKLNEEGVDQCVAASFLYSGGRTANGALCSINKLPNEMVIVGTKGNIKLGSPFRCPTEITTPDKTYKFPLPETALPCFFPNSSGFRYEAIRVRECLREGLKECPEMPLKDSELLAELMDEMRRQVGVVYPEDNE